MVAINRSNIRRVRRPSIMNAANTCFNNVPYLSQLSSIDRLLILCGVSLLLIVLLSVALLASSRPNVPSTAVGTFDPRLTSELLKTGLSPEALLRRGGGKRISVGSNRPLDSEENAVALDILQTLQCQSLQDQLERKWGTYIDAQIISQEASKEFDTVQDWNYVNRHVDDFAGALAREVVGEEHQQQLDHAMDRRRLEQLPWMEPDEQKNGHVDDFGKQASSSKEKTNNQSLDFYPKLTGQHLFCLAANSLTFPKYNPRGNDSSTSMDTKKVKDLKVQCNLEDFEIRQSLLYLWSAAKSQMAEEVLRKTLELVTEHPETLRGNNVNLWYPENDVGTQGMLRVINSGFEGRLTYNFDSEPADSTHSDMYRFWDLPKNLVGPNKLFVDVGSALGLTSMLISYLYPQTTIVSIEPASPSWLIQNLNFRCNLPREARQYVHPILAGVGTKHHDDNDYMMKMIWRPSMTTATRSWNPEKEFDYAVDMELIVHLRTLKQILAEATPEDLPMGTPISVLNLDCEGCEYNLIPSLHETTFNSIGLILGRTNWGFIPTVKKPSSKRGKETHERLCTHYNFATRCKECCDFPSLSVRPRQFHGNNSRGHTEMDAQGPVSKTVSEVAGDLCKGFEEWAIQQHLYDIPDDFGWNELSAFAAGE